ncbi:MAG: hypothetical protein J6S44_04895, partial [Clostridia bacterium]|nr:hypothetical protein [Clostridia bacterium]
LTERHARALLRLPSDLWAKTAERMINGKYNVAAAEKLVEEMLGRAEARQVKKGRGKNKGVLRDLKLFYNSVDRAMEMVRRCGISVKSRKEEAEGETRLIISIPKTS